MRIFISLALWLCLLNPAAAQVASAPVKTGHALTQLVSEDTSIQPGGTITLGLHQVLQDHWHVYWSNPGDSGLPLTLAWDLPDGWSAGEIIFPAPQPLAFPPLMNYGHEGRPAFLVDMTAAPDAQPGDVATLKVRADWLICDDVCVPEMANLEIILPISEGPGAQDPLGGPIIAAARTKVPTSAPFAAAAYDIGGKPEISFAIADMPSGTPRFFPFAEGLIEPAGAADFQTSSGRLTARFVPSFEYSPATLTSLDGLLTFTKEGVKAPHTAYRVSVPFGPAPAGVSLGDAPPAQSVIAVLGLALLGGLILNIMPCVFPIIFLKAGSIAQSAATDMATVRRHGLFYTAGVILSFLAIAGVLLALRAGGAELGWGFQLQHPLPVSLFAIIMLLIGLNLAGVFEFGTSVQGLGNEMSSKGGNSGAFFTGLLAVAVAAPCVGPFLGGALSYGLTAPGAIGLAVFAVMGLGLALPYLLLSFSPALARLLPKPGLWMQTFKQFLAFPMFATCIWLIWTLTRMSGTQGLVMLLSAMLIIAFGAWIYGRSQGKGGGIASYVGALGAATAAIAIVSSIAIAPVAAVAVNAPGSGDRSKLPSDVFSAARLDSLRGEGTPVFVDFTAAWCVTCQSNKITAIKRARVIDAFHETGTVYMVADWTVQDAQITKMLEAFGRSGVPLYLYYAAGAAEPVILPQILTPDMMLKTLTQS